MKGIILLSTGIDSPVAGYIMKNQNIDLISVYFSSTQKGDDVVKKLAKHIDSKKLYIVNHRRILDEFIENCKDSLRCVLCKRMMFKVAEIIAKKENADFIITGENLAQVASQTVENLKVTRTGISYPVLTPLLGFDKQEIVNIAKDIGTFDINLEPVACCHAVPQQPMTKARLDKVIQEENKIDYDKLLNESVENISEFDI